MRGSWGRRRSAAIAAAAALVLAGCGPSGDAARSAAGPGATSRPEVGFRAGAAGIGDPYFPTDGNGGYDVEDYDLDVRYDPDRGRLAGVATIRARATHGLSRFNLDLVGLTVRQVEVDGAQAEWTRQGDELRITPAAGLPAGREFTAVIRYDGAPASVAEGDGAVSGFVPTPHGVVIAGQPDSAATWFPVNDHPDDRARFTVRASVPAGLTAVSNGELTGTRDAGDRTIWTWSAPEPMAPYLSTLVIGRFGLDRYTRDGIRFLDAVDENITRFYAPATGSGFAIAARDGAGHQRLTRTIEVPAGGGRLEFSVDRRTEQGFDLLFVEAREAGREDWVTLPDRNGHTTADVPRSCPDLLEVYPGMGRYLTADGDDGCRAVQGAWAAAGGASDGYERWSIDLGRYAGRSVEVAISYLQDEAYRLPGVMVDDIEVAGGDGSTSFEPDADAADGWRATTVPPAGQTRDTRPSWTFGDAGDAPEPLGTNVALSLDRQAEIIEFLAGVFGPYPFADAGAIVHDAPLKFALENQTRSTYATDFFTETVDGDSVLVHELAHQWTGNDLTVARWRHIWLNEGFATYAEWLWSEREGRLRAQERFDEAYGIPANSEFWDLKIGDPGPDGLFEQAIYQRGAMTLHALRKAVGDDAFFRLVRQWTTSRAGRAVTTEQFIEHAEKVSGADLGTLFDAWLFTGKKPPKGS